MKILHTLMLAGLIAFTGCMGATAPKMNRLSVGMTKQEVVSVMGRPPIISLVGEKAFCGEKVLDYISPLW
jgi:outer membrane protein assembly factor BamE (lipoprotein component of BamABCDE complex)